MPRNGTNFASLNFRNCICQIEHKRRDNNWKRDITIRESYAFVSDANKCFRKFSLFLKFSFVLFFIWVIIPDETHRLLWSIIDEIKLKNVHWLAILIVVSWLTNHITRQELKHLWKMCTIRITVKLWRKLPEIYRLFHMFRLRRTK